MMKYFVPVKTWLFGMKRYLYMDAREEYHADSLFRKHGITRMIFGKEWISPDKKYCLIYVWVAKKQAKQFEAAIEEMPDRMRLLGYSDYCEVWESIFRK